MDTYKTIDGCSTGLYKEKGSKFLAFAYNVTDPEQVPQIIAEIKKKYYDARHHCYAWRIGPEGDRFRMVDDGEPSSTAGKPILGQMLSRDITDVLIVVVRYFGGVLLGTPGLIRSYKEAAADALESANIVEKFVEDRIRVHFTYFVMNDIMKIIKDVNPNVMSQNFDIDCTMDLSIRKSLGEGLRERLSKVEGVLLETI